MTLEAHLQALADSKFSCFWLDQDARPAWLDRRSGIIASSTRFCMVPGSAYDGRVAWSVGYTGQGVGASRFGARIGLELLGYDPTDVLDMSFIRKKALPWPPEPFRWIDVTLTRKEMDRADCNNGKRGLWLKILDRLNLGFAC
jgi:hypothetical protein